MSHKNWLTSVVNFSGTMVSPAFSFSVGDFIAAVQLLDSVRKALKSTGGAAQDCQDTLVRLNNLIEILKLLQSVFAADVGLDSDQRI